MHSTCGLQHLPFKCEKNTFTLKNRQEEVQENIDWNSFSKYDTIHKSVTFKTAITIRLKTVTLSSSHESSSYYQSGIC